MHIHFRQPRNGESHKMREMISGENNNHMIVCFGEISPKKRKLGQVLGIAQPCRSGVAQSGGNWGEFAGYNEGSFLPIGGS